MYLLLPTLNFVLAAGSLALAVVTIILFADYYLWRGKYFSDKLNQFSWHIVIGVTVATLALSLLYSEYFGFIPCSLCWLQRIAAYPQALMSILAFQNKDYKHFPVYGIGLSIFGLAVALYQYVEQMWPKQGSATGEILPCLLDGTGADCAEKVINEFGFVTFPLISAITFSFLIVVYLYMLRSR